MMNTRITVSFAVLACALLSISAVAQEEGEMPAMTPEQQKEMMVWMEAAQPGQHHEHLAPFVGTWKGKVQMWMTPDAPEMTEESLTEAAWIMGGRYLEWKHTGNYGGMPYEARAIEGYNNVDKRYESMWIDNFGTLVMYFKGSCSDDGKSREMSSQFTDAVTGGTFKYRVEYRWIDKDHFTYTGYMDKGDGEFKNVLVTYERQ
jgi:hypothetical protein